MTELSSKPQAAVVGAKLIKLKINRLPLALANGGWGSILILITYWLSVLYLTHDTILYTHDYLIWQRNDSRLFGFIIGIKFRQVFVYQLFHNAFLIVPIFLKYR